MANFKFFHYNFFRWGYAQGSGVFNLVSRWLLVSKIWNRSGSSYICTFLQFYMGVCSRVESVVSRRLILTKI